MKVLELKHWLEKIDEEGATELEVEMDCFYGTIKLTAVEPSGTVAESIMLKSC